MTWIEKYRPKTLDEIVGQEAIVSKLKSYSDIKDCPHFIFVGNPGCGKTASAYAFANHLGVGIVEFNASDERGIGFIREKIKTLLETATPKIILLDEADALTSDAQQALRRMMEKALKYTPNRLILTANDISRIIEPILSRCSIQHFKPLPKSEAAKVILRIIKEEGVAGKIASSKEELKSLVLYLIEYSKGDMRRAINALQDMCVTGQRLTRESIEQYFASASLAKQIVKFAMDGNWQDALLSLENFLIEKNMDGRDVLHELYRASADIKSPVLRAKFLESLKLADIALSYPDTSPLIQLSEAIMKLYVYTHSLPKDLVR